MIQPQVIISKVLLDAIFGHKNFRREIIWNLQTASGFKTQVKGYVRGHDVILYYVGAKPFYFDKQYLPHKPEYIARFKKVDSDGRRYRDDRPNKRRQYLDQTKGIMLTDVWSDIMSFQQAATLTERLGYDTQKPKALLRRIVQASCPPGGTVLDPFCGCGTTLEAAQELGRKWMGIDIAIHAIKRVSAVRLRDRMGLVEGIDFMIEGVPRNVEGAHDLWKRDKYHFQKWAVEQVDGFVTSRKRADGGIDGRLYFGEPGEELRSMAIEVKGGKNVNIGVVRALRGVLERDVAAMAGLIVLAELGKRQRQNFGREMASAGDLEGYHGYYPRMQMLTVRQILEGKRFKTPWVAGRGDPNPMLPLG